MKKSGLRLQDVPVEFRERLINNLKGLRGFEDPMEVIGRNIKLSEAFPWALSEEGHMFWMDVDNGARISTDDLLDAIIEAQARGFEVGVFTEFGQVVATGRNGEPFSHELLPDGSFYYKNIKVRNGEGKWIKPISEKKYLKLQQSNGDPNQVPELRQLESILDEIIKSLGISKN